MGRDRGGCGASGSLHSRAPCQLCPWTQTCLQGDPIGPWRRGESCGERACSAHQGPPQRLSPLPPALWTLPPVAEGSRAGKHARAQACSLLPGGLPSSEGLAPRALSRNLASAFSGITPSQEPPSSREHGHVGAAGCAPTPPGVRDRGGKEGVRPPGGTGRGPRCLRASACSLCPSAPRRPHTSAWCVHRWRRTTQEEGLASHQCVPVYTSRARRCNRIILKEMFVPSKTCHLAGHGHAVQQDVSLTTPPCAWRAGAGEGRRGSRSRLPWRQSLRLPCLRLYLAKGGVVPGACRVPASGDGDGAGGTRPLPAACLLRTALLPAPTKQAQAPGEAWHRCVKLCFRKPGLPTSRHRLGVTGC